MADQEQEFRIKQLLAQRQDDQGRRMTIASLARTLEAPYGSVAGVIYGLRPGPALRVRIAEFLGTTVEELFNNNQDDNETKTMTAG